MIGLGTIINTAAIVAGGILGKFFGKHISEQFQTTMSTACGISTFFIGAAGTMSGMLSISDGSISSGNSMLTVICLVLGAIVGELLNIEKWFESLGEWLKKKSGNQNDNKFIDGFLTATFTVCIGAMAIVGSIQDGIYGDYSILATKSVLDLIIVMVMTGSFGVGCSFSAVPVAVLQGAITLLARFIEPIMTEAALANLSLIGSILIACVGINLVWGKKVRVANFLPSLIVAVIAAFISF